MDVQSFSVTKGTVFNIKVPPEYMGGTFVSNAPNIVTFNGNNALAVDYGSATVEFNFNNNGCSVSKTFIINVGCDESITLVQQEGHGEIYEYEKYYVTEMASAIGPSCFPNPPKHEVIKTQYRKVKKSVSWEWTDEIANCPCSGVTTSEVLQHQYYPKWTVSQIERKVCHSVPIQQPVVGNDGNSTVTPTDVYVTYQYMEEELVQNGQYDFPYTVIKQKCSQSCQ